ncbi:hypothetical protein ACFSL4_30205, partial [Streptomyces caeni]
GGQGEQPGQQKSQGQGQGKSEGQKQGKGKGKEGGQGKGELPPVGAQHGVHAGEGGSFNVSVPALVAGGVLIVGALGAALHRLFARGPSGTG